MTLIPSDWTPHEEENLDTEQGCDREKTTEDTARRQPPTSQGERLKRNQTCQHLELGFLASRL